MGVKVHVLREGTRFDGREGKIKVSRMCCSAVVLVVAGGRNIVVDPGAMGYAGEVVGALRRLDIGPEDVGVVVNTHMHLDHTFNNYLFPNAVIYTPTSVWHYGGGNRVEIYQHVVDPGIPGVRILDTPGHVEKHVSVAVETDEGCVVVAGDAVRECVILDGRVPPRYHDPVKYLESMRKVFDEADIIIPGHGPVIGGDRLRRLKKMLGGMRF